MPENDRQVNISRFGLIWPIAALALAIAALVTTGDAPLVSSRPKSPGSYDTPNPPGATGIRSAHAQLWEDPLESARRTIREKEDLELSRAGQVQEMLQNIIDRDPERFLIMPVLTFGGPYATDKEERMRNRYAVLSALGTSGFKLSYPQRMSATTVPIVTDFGPTRRLMLNKVQVPIKLFSKHEEEGPGESPHGHKKKDIRYILVLWVNESQLGQKPLMGLAQILEQLFPGPWEDAQQKPRLAIIGPSQSDTLREFLMEDERWGEAESGAERPLLDDDSRKALCGDRSLAAWFGSRSWFCWLRWIFPGKPDCCNSLVATWLNELKKKDHFQRFADPTIFSPRATVSFEDLESPRALEFKNCGLKLVPAIGSDLRLFEALAEELGLRGALPESRESKQHVVLVTERDTLYGRSVPETFRKVLKVTAEQNLHVFTYLRGIDGEVPSRDAVEAKAANSSDREALALLELPEGTSQRDYLRRLASEIVRFDARLRQDGKGGISAVGVVGSDIFDKLLVLRALRNRFPTARFFTTDLDARFSSPAEYAFTRNLIVASHFGLGLNRSLRYDVPPFRDSYQTSTFFATLRALDSEQLRASLKGKAYDDPWGRNSQRNTLTQPPDEEQLSPLEEEKGFLEPLVFEIARTGPYQLTSPVSPVSERIQPQSNRSQAWWTWLFYSLVTLAALIFFIGCLTYYFDQVHRGVLALRDWAARFSARVLHLVRGHGAGTRLGLEDKWLFFGLVVTVSLYVLLLTDDRRIQGEPLTILEGISVWPSVLLLYAAVVWAVFLVFSWLRISQENLTLLRRDYTSSPDSPEPEDASASGASPSELLRQCAETERRRHRLQRVFLQTAAYYIFSLLLFYVTSSFPGIPYRGWVSQACALLLTHLALIAFYVVSFFVLDVMRNSSRFIMDLVGQEYDLTRGEIGATREPLNDARRHELSELYTIQLIARHTRLPGRMLVYPFLFALLLASARLSFFDSWDIGLTLLAVIGVLLLGVLLGGFMLRKNAQRARRRVLRKLHDSLADALADSRQGGSVERLRNVISDIQSEQRGAFRPLSEDPVIAAAFIPLGGTGTLVLLERLLHYL